jgi:hypothetical protein
MDVIKKYEITQYNMEIAISAYAYTIARADKKDEVCVALNKGFKLFRRKMNNVDRREYRRIFKV